ncbi:MAG: hypothetical protein QOE66_917, partial [Chloroflexota bacterium]|nr:hypothetical protein [Chloroflexota bacterium]
MRSILRFASDLHMSIPLRSRQPACPALFGSEARPPSRRQDPPRNRDNPQPPAIPHVRGFAWFGARVRLLPTRTSDRRAAPTIATIRILRFVRKRGPASDRGPERTAIVTIRNVRRSLMIVASLCARVRPRPKRARGRRATPGDLASIPAIVDSPGAPGSARGARLPRPGRTGPRPPSSPGAPTWHAPPTAGAGLVRRGPVFRPGLRKSLM